MIICALDLETTGLSAEKDQVTEVGAILWDTELNAPVKFFSKLIKIDGAVPEEIVKLTGITDELLQKYGEPVDQVWADFIEFAKPAHCLMAHNAPFDRGFIEHRVDKDKLPSQWIDSCVDVDFPESISTRKLTHLAAEHGFVNPFAHRAVTDVLTMCQLVSKYPWNQTVTNAATPSVQLRAMVTYADNQKAKSNGFRWDGTKKIWVKSVKIPRVEEEIKKCLEQGFVARQVG